MNDLVVRLRLNSSQWDTSINSAKKSLQGFEATSKKGSIEIGGLGKMFGSAGSLIGKFAGGIGVAMTAQEAFNTAINSSATLQSEYNDVLNAGKKSVNDFFNSLVNGDWTRYNDGIIKAIKLNKDFAKSQRQLTSWNNIAESRLDQSDALASNLEAIFEDTSRPFTEREEAYNKFVTNLTKTIQQTEKELGMAEKDLTNILQNLGVSDVINKDNFKKVYDELVNPYSETLKELEQYQKDKNIIDNWKNPNVLKYSENESQMMKGKEQYIFNEKYSKEIQYYYNALLRIQDNLTEENKEMLKQYYDGISQITDRLGTTKKSLKDAADAIKEPSDEMAEAANAMSTVSDSLAQVNESVPQGSLAEIEQKISNLKNKLQNATSDGVRYGIQQELKKTYTLKVMMENRSKGTDLLDGSIKTQGKNPLDDINSGNLPKLNLDNDGLKENINMYDDLGESLLGVTNILSSLDGTVSDSASGWLKYASTVISSVAASIKPIQDLTVALQAKAVAEAAGSAASVPVVGWIKAIAAITAVIAAFASIPKNANGGIIGGNSFVGDNVLIRANSGEMILNKRQQANLFNLLDNGYGTKGNITNGNVEFRIQGKELVGVLQAYNNKTSKFM